MSERREGTSGAAQMRLASQEAPAQARADAAAVATTGAPASAGARETDVLVACADEDARCIVGAALRHDGWRVQEIAEAIAVPAAVREGRPVLVVTSYPNACGDGCTVTESLRADRATADLPILSVTSRGFPADLARATAAGVTASLVMPVLPAEVVAAVRRLVGAPALMPRARREQPGGPAEDPG